MAEVILWSLVTLVVVVFVMYAQSCAYHNGVTDGFGFAVDPKNPGYQSAGRYLRKYMSHRWTELNEPPYQQSDPVEP